VDPKSIVLLIWFALIAGATSIAGWLMDEPPHIILLMAVFGGTGAALAVRWLS
jgi:hypothetical protein